MMSAIWQCSRWYLGPDINDLYFVMYMRIVTLIDIMWNIFHPILKNYAKRDTRARRVWKCCVKMLCENVMWKFCVSGGLVGVVGWVGDRLERLVEWETGWTVWVNGWLVGRVGWVGNWLEMFPPSFLESSLSKFPSKFPYQFVFVCLLKCLFVCFKTGFPLPVYFLFLPSVFKQPST